jgi:hypothetical protein
VARSSAGRRAPAARQGSLCARSTRAAARARGGLAWIAAAPAETGRDRARTTALPVAAVAAPPCSRRSCRPPCADPSPAPAMTLGGRPLQAPAHSTVSFPVARPACRAAIADRNHGKARNGGPESGICAHSAFRSSPVRPSPTRDPASRGAGGARNAPPGHSAGPAECGAARTATQGCRRRSPHPGAAMPQAPLDA